MYYPQNFYNFLQPQQTPNQPIMVSGLESAKRYATAPNSNVVLFDSNSDIFYLKSTDASNFPQIRTFKFEEIKQEATPAPTETPAVTREEFEQLMAEINSLKERTQNNEKRWSKGENRNGK